MIQQLTPPTHRLSGNAMLYALNRDKCTVIRYRRPGKDVTLFTIHHIPTHIIIGGVRTEFTHISIEMNKKWESLTDVLAGEIYKFTGIRLEEWQ